MPAEIGIADGCGQPDRRQGCEQAERQQGFDAEQGVDVGGEGST
jgi:hypothetical protein